MYADLHKLTAVEAEPLSDTALFQEDGLRNIGEHAAAIVHELRSPLVGLHAQLQMLRRRLAADDICLQQRFDMITGELNRLSRLCDQVMSLANGREDAPQMLDLAVICKETEDILRAMAISRGCQLKLELAERLPRIIGQEELLRRLLINLVSNAIQATSSFREDGKITIRLVGNSKELQLSVRDNGPGMDALTIKHIFDPYFTTRDKGCGMGLAICTDIAHRHNGNLQVFSSRGNGATFVLTLPVQQS